MATGRGATWGGDERVNRPGGPRGGGAWGRGEAEGGAGGGSGRQCAPCAVRLSSAGFLLTACDSRPGKPSEVRGR